jgi:hypothetical protein
MHTLRSIAATPSDFKKINPPMGSDALHRPALIIIKLTAPRGAFFISWKGGFVLQ